MAVDRVRVGPVGGSRSVTCRVTVGVNPGPFAGDRCRIIYKAYKRRNYVSAASIFYRGWCTRIGGCTQTFYCSRTVRRWNKSSRQVDRVRVGPVGGSRSVTCRVTVGVNPGPFAGDRCRIIYKAYKRRNYVSAASIFYRGWCTRIGGCTQTFYCSRTVRRWNKSSRQVDRVRVGPVGGSRSVTCRVTVGVNPGPFAGDRCRIIYKAYKRRNYVSAASIFYRGWCTRIGGCTQTFYCSRTVRRWNKSSRQVDRVRVGPVGGSRSVTCRVTVGVNPGPFAGDRCRIIYKAYKRRNYVSAASIFYRGWCTRIGGCTQTFYCSRTVRRWNKSSRQVDRVRVGPVGGSRSVTCRVTVGVNPGPFAGDRCRIIYKAYKRRNYVSAASIFYRGWCTRIGGCTQTFYCSRTVRRWNKSSRQVDRVRVGPVGGSRSVTCRVTVGVNPGPFAGDRCRIIYKAYKRRNYVSAASIFYRGWCTRIGGCTQTFYCSRTVRRWNKSSRQVDRVRVGPVGGSRSVTCRVTVGVNPGPFAGDRCRIIYKAYKRRNYVSAASIFYRGWCTRIGGCTQTFYCSRTVRRWNKSSRQVDRVRVGPVGGSRSVTCRVTVGVNPGPFAGDRCRIIYKAYKRRNYVSAASIFYRGWCTRIGGCTQTFYCSRTVRRWNKSSRQVDRVRVGPVGGSRSVTCRVTVGVNPGPFAGDRCRIIYKAYKRRNYVSAASIFYRGWCTRIGGCSTFYCSRTIFYRGWCTRIGGCTQTFSVAVPFVGGTRAVVRSIVYV